MTIRIRFFLASSILLAAIFLPGYLVRAEPPSQGQPPTNALLVGVPFEDIGSVVDAGVVDVIASQPGLGLSGATNTYWWQSTEAGRPEPNDLFGKAMVTADFNHDGMVDIAVGAPGENNYSGAVNIIYRFPGGGANQVFFRQEDVLAEESMDGAEFGSTLVAGDFNGDSYTDLAVGAPGYNSQNGAVVVLYGGAGQLTPHGAKLFRGDSWALLGMALASADFDGDGYDDLVVGAPNADIGNALQPNRSGQVTVYYGPFGAIPRKQVWTQSSTGQDISEPGDDFGAALATGDFNGDGHSDLAVGVPGENRGDTRNAGAVNILYNHGSELATTGAQVWFPGAGQACSRSGATLAVGDFNNDGSDDLAIGTPNESYVDTINPGVIEKGGRVDVYLGSPGQGIATIRASVFNPIDHQFKYLGYALAAGDFTGDGLDDLVMGVPGYNTGPHIADGAIMVSYSNASGFAAPVIMTQRQLAHVAAEDNDNFGYTLAVLPPDETGAFRLYEPVLLHY